MNVTIDNALHDELPAEVSHLAFIVRQTGFIAYIDELAVLHYLRTCLRLGLVRCENRCVLDYFICFHVGLYLYGYNRYLF